MENKKCKAITVKKRLGEGNIQTNLVKIESRVSNCSLMLHRKGTAERFE